MMISEILSRAADRLEADGWQSGSGWPYWMSTRDARATYRGRVCIATAIDLEADSDFSFMKAATTVEALLIAAGEEPQRMHAGQTGLLIDWNIAPGRTAEEAVSLLRRAAVVARERYAEDVLERIYWPC